MVPVAGVLKDKVQREGKSASHARIPLLSIAELFDRERPYEEGGDLRQGQVIVCDVQPMVDTKLALRVHHNMDNGTAYHYFLYLTDDTIDRIGQSLQVILAAEFVDKSNIGSFSERLKAVRGEQSRVLDNLRSICSTRSLRFSLLTDEPLTRFRVHNASNEELARMFVRYQERGFLLWAEGRTAMAAWNALPRFLPDDETDRLFVPLRQFELKDHDKERFERGLDRTLRKYFPGMEGEVKQLILRGGS